MTGRSVPTSREPDMPGRLLLLILAIFTAAVGGFGSPPGLTAGLGQVLFFICLVALMVSLVLASLRRAPG